MLTSAEFYAKKLKEADFEPSNGERCVLCLLNLAFDQGI